MGSRVSKRPARALVASVPEGRTSYTESFRLFGKKKLFTFEKLLGPLEWVGRMAYSLDANVFINAKDLHHGFDFCTAFWERLTRENRAGGVYSIERVGRRAETGLVETDAVVKVLISGKIGGQ